MRSEQDDSAEGWTGVPGGSAVGDPAPLRAVIFDVDGTLAETEREGHLVAFNQAFTSHQLPYQWGVQEYGELLSTTGGRGRLRRYLLARGHVDDADSLAAQLHATKTALFREWVQSDGVQLRPGVAELIEDLRHAGITVAVASTGSRAWVLPLLKQQLPGTGYGGTAFATVVTGDDVERLKPDPQAYLLALSRLGLQPTEALAVEDSPPGLASAVNAGVPCLVISSEYNRVEAFPGAAAVLSSYLVDDAPGPAMPAWLTGGVTAASLRALHRSCLLPRS